MTTLALGLEGTLIDNTRSVYPRPGSGAFFAFCDGRFARVMIYGSDVSDAVATLADEGHLSRPLLDCSKAAE